MIYVACNRYLMGFLSVREFKVPGLGSGLEVLELVYTFLEEDCFNKLEHWIIRAREIIGLYELCHSRITFLHEFTV